MQRGPAATRLLEATRIREGTIQYRREHLQINQVRRRDTIIARPHKATERAFYDLSEQGPGSRIRGRRTSNDEDSKPIWYTVTVYPADRNQSELEAAAFLYPRHPLPR